MGIRDRGSVEPQEEALVQSTPNADGSSGQVPESTEEEVVARYEPSTTTTAELLPIPAFLPPAAEVPVGAAELAAPAAEVEVLPGVTEEARSQPCPVGESHSELKLGLSVLALVGFLSWFQESRRTSHQNSFVRRPTND
jgi:hypothetical protein